jgi:hypothetical protein
MFNLSQETIEAARLAVRLMFEGAKWREAIEKAIEVADPRVVRASDVAAAIEIMC